MAGTGTTGCRLVHGENDGFPGLVVDRYAGTLVMKLYTTAWVPHLREMAEAVLINRGPDVEREERFFLREPRNFLPLRERRSLAIPAKNAVLVAGL